MLQRVYESALESEFLERIIIATDHQEILEAANDFGAEVRMTSPSHNSGTERVAEVVRDIDYSIVINIQGDEPLLRGKMVDALVDALQDESLPMATIAKKENDMNLINDLNVVKVVTDKEGFALYFSRAPLPFHSSDYFLHHVGIYGYQRKFLLSFSGLPRSRLERTEQLEQLRALENGFRIKIIETEHKTLSVDSPEDIINVENFLRKRTND
jgi:3-deoxy-manno-octulosonate cytidylyltransferase (CMP-KDO synthetase)